MTKKQFSVGMVGGAAGSFMGEVHRAAMARVPELQLVCGAFGSTRNASYETGKRLALQSNRVYGTYREMFRRERTLPDGERMDFVVNVTPNTMHYPVAMIAMDTGFPVLSEKPFTCNLDEAVNLTRKQRVSNTLFRVALVYPAYPALQMLRAKIEEGVLGTIRSVTVSYVDGWMAKRLETSGNRQALWRSDARRNGIAGVVEDMLSHCFYVAEWLTGLTVAEVCPDARPTVPGRQIPDDCATLVHFTNGVRGLFVASQIATGHRDGLTVEIIGDKASATWSQQTPAHVALRTVEGALEILGQVDADALVEPLTMQPYGNNEGYIAALTEVYRGFVRRLTEPEDSTPVFDGMNLDDGLRSVVFASSVALGLGLPPDEAPVAKWYPVDVPVISEL